MKRQVCLGLLAIALVQTFVQPVLAQQAGSGSYKIPKNYLQKVEPYMSRPQIDILDESPIVKDRRTRERQTTYEIVVPPLPAESAGQGSAGGSAPGVVRITPSRDGRILASPGFQSNIPARSPVAAAHLPSGVTTGIHGKIDRPIAAAPMKPGNLLRAANAGTAAPQVIRTYGQTPVAVAGSGSSSRRTTESVTGKLQKGSLLK